ncbi:MAG: hypothetical protein HYS62_01875 [Candidatus Aenigmarchaeota archaeon]|nr:hypothetical protein [Candidatus Aenigmarchaeota archaeon]
MKFKSSWIGLFLIAVMLFSTFAYAVIQSLYPKQAPTLPDSNIIDYALEPALKDALVQYGATVITFEYNLGCNNCVNQKATLEFFATDYKEQIWLEEIHDDNLDVSTIRMSSVYGEENLVDANETQIVSSLCGLMVAPPATCALQKT